MRAAMAVLGTVGALLAVAAPAPAASGLKQDLAFASERTTIPARLSVGQRLRLDVTVRNRGRGLSRAPEVQFLVACASNCNTPTTPRPRPDVGEPFASTQLRDLRPGESRRVRRTVTIPRSLDAHAGRIVACAVERYVGPERPAAERRISDNCKVVGITRIGRPRTMRTELRLVTKATVRSAAGDIAMSADVLMTEDRWLANFTGSRWSLQQGGPPTRVLASSWTSTDPSCALVSTSAEGRFGELRTTSDPRGLELEGVELPTVLFTVTCGGETRFHELALADGLLDADTTDVGIDGGRRSYRFAAGDLRLADDAPVSGGGATATLTVRRGP